MSYPSVSVEPNELEQGLRNNHPDLKPYIKNCIKLGMSNEEIYKRCNVPSSMFEQCRAELKREKEKQEKK